MHNQILSVLWATLRIGILIAIVWLLKAFLIDLYTVAGPSMEPTLRDRSVVLGTKYDKTFTYGQVIIFSRKGRQDYIISRVVALPGDTIKIDRGVFYVNGEPAEEPYLEIQNTTETSSFLEEGTEIAVPEGNFFVMGDNREGSIDSREWGFVQKENIKATYLRCAFKC